MKSSTVASGELLHGMLVAESVLAMQKSWTGWGQELMQDMDLLSLECVYSLTNISMNQ
jgi:hypothetical protein